MRTKLVLVVVFLAASLFITKADSAGNQELDYKGNNCTSCHSQIREPLSLSSRYFEWHSSLHRDKGVSCDKCHGGDPTAKEKIRAHRGILPYRDQQSRTNFRNLPTTCGACHKGLVDSFRQSKHFLALQGSSLGPSCTTCHGHMASEVIMSPPQTATMCSFCHNTVNGLLRPNPEIGDRAEAAMDSLNRADVAVGWASSLLREGEIKRVYIPTERLEVVSAQGSLKEAKRLWHTYDIDATVKKADEAFLTAMRAKDDLSKKLGH